MLAAWMDRFFEQNSLRKGCGLGELNSFHNDVACFFYDLMVQSANRAEDYFKVWKVLRMKIKFVVAAYTFHFQVFHLNSFSTDETISSWRSEFPGSRSKGSSSNIWFFRTVINEIPQIGQGTYWNSPTRSNWNICLHLGHVKVTELSRLCIFGSQPLLEPSPNLRNILVDSSNYIEENALTSK